VTAPALLSNVITVDGWSCYDHPNPPPDEDGNIWVWQTIEGWYGGVDVRGAAVPRPLVDGEFDGPAPFGGRTVTVSGQLVSPTRQALQRGMQRVSEVLSGATRRAQLIVDEQWVPITRGVDVRLGGSILVARQGPVLASWSLTFYASDPLRYGVTGRSVLLDPFARGVGRTYNLIPPRHYGAIGSSGRARVTNTGNAATPLTVTFYGPSKNPSLQIVGGSRVQLLMTLLTGERVVIDSAQRTVIYNGSASRRQFLSADSRWLYLPPGDSDLFYSTEEPRKPLPDQAITNIAVNPTPASVTGWLGTDNSAWVMTYANGEVRSDRQPGAWEFGAAQMSDLGNVGSPILLAGANFQRSVEIWVDAPASVFEVVPEWEGFKAVDLVPNQWTRVVQQFTATGHSGIWPMSAGVVMWGGAPAGIHCKFRHAQLVANPSGRPVAYFDGSTPDTSSNDYAWTGTANSSTSTSTPYEAPGQCLVSWRDGWS
jgi:hypothetical protein